MTEMKACLNELDNELKGVICQVNNTISQIDKYREELKERDPKRVEERFAFIKSRIAPDKSDDEFLEIFIGCLNEVIESREN